MARRKGKVSKIGKSKYSFFIQLDGDGHYFNTKYNPKCGVGDVVGLTYEPKGEQRSQIKDVKLLEDNGGPKGYQESSGGGFGGGSSKGGGSYASDPDRQASIIYQSSRKDALVMAELILSNDGIKLPKAEDARRTVIEELVSEFTLSFFTDASNPSKATAGAKAVSDDAEGGDDDSWDEPESGGSDDWDDGDDWE